jgi:CRP-like cAMP-binding protein
LISGCIEPNKSRFSVQPWERRQSAQSCHSGEPGKWEETLHSSLYQSPSNLLQLRFSRLNSLTEQEMAVLRLIETRGRISYQSDSRLLSEGAEIRAPQFIFSGWAAKVRQLADGRRQILAVVLPGDAIGLCSRARPLALTTVLALTPVKTVEAIELSVAWRESHRASGLAAAIDIAAAEDEYYLYGHAVRLGRQTAYERMAHFFCELESRLSARGLAEGGAFPLPMTQEMLADAMGLSVVHVNRTLQQMRREGIIDLSRGRIAILELEILRRSGEFSAPKVSRQVAAEGIFSSAPAAVRNLSP